MWIHNRRRARPSLDGVRCASLKLWWSFKILSPSHRREQSPEALCSKQRCNGEEREHDSLHQPPGGGPFGCGELSSSKQFTSPRCSTALQASDSRRVPLHTRSDVVGPVWYGGSERYGSPPWCSCWQGNRGSSHCTEMHSRVDWSCSPKSLNTLFLVENHFSWRLHQ